MMKNNCYIIINCIIVMFFVINLKFQTILMPCRPIYLLNFMLLNPLNFKKYIKCTCYKVIMQKKYSVELLDCSTRCTYLV